MTKSVSMPSMPFEPDKPVPLPPLPKPDPVRDRARAYRKQLAEEYKSELAELRSYAEEEWRKYRADHPFADNHTEYVDAIVESLAPAPPPRLSEHEAFRLGVPYATRLASLGENGVFDEFCKVAVYRGGGKMRVSALREMLGPYAPAMTDVEFFGVIDAAELMVHNGQVVFITGTVEQERRADYPTLPIHAEREYRPLLAVEDDRLSPEDL